MCDNVTNAKTHSQDGSGDDESRTEWKMKTKMKPSTKCNKTNGKKKSVRRKREPVSATTQ